MNRGTVILVVAIALIAGGFLTLMILASPQTLGLARVQTLNPEASTLQATPQQALIFLLYAGFAIGSLVVLGIVIALIFRSLDREIARNSKQQKS